MRKIVVSFLCLFALCASAQVDENVHFKGLVMDDEAYAQVPEQPMQLTRDYVSLPSNYSLQKYCPTPKSQGAYGTCTSWATAYAARTIVEAIRNNWTDRNVINRESYSPPFVYKQIKDAYDTNCQNGSAIGDALTLMKNKGVPKYYAFNPMCTDYIPTRLFTDAYNHRIEDFSKLFSIDASQSVKVQTVKKALYENCPVVIGMNCYSSFDLVKDVWSGAKDKYEGGHAMCVVAYDDQKYGGAFLLMNSWGTNWGLGGFGWVRYSDFASCTKYAYQVYVPKKATPTPVVDPTPMPKPATDSKPIISWLSAMSATSQKYVVRAGVNSKSKITEIIVLVNGTASRGINAVTNDGYEHIINQEVLLNPGKNTISIKARNASGSTHLVKEVTCILSNTNSLSGSMYVQLATGEKMNVLVNKQSTVPNYKVTQSYISGTRYRIYISNNEPAYVYVIASDLTNSVSRVFPPTDKISAALVYKSNNIALPDEKWYMEMDNIVGTDYLCVLYSKYELNIDDVISKIKSSNGTFVQRLTNVLGTKMAKSSEVTLESNSASFKALTSGTIVPIVLEITHK